MHSLRYRPNKTYQYVIQNIMQKLYMYFSFLSFLKFHAHSQICTTSEGFPSYFFIMATSFLYTPHVHTDGSCRLGRGSGGGIMWISLLMLDCYLTQSPESREDKGEGFPMSYLRNSTRIDALYIYMN